MVLTAMILIVTGSLKGYKKFYLMLNYFSSINSNFTFKLIVVEIELLCRVKIKK